MNCCLPSPAEIGDGVAASSAADVTWDLSPLFRAPDDPRIAETLSELEARSADFERRYRGAIAGNPTAATLREGLEELESILDTAYRLSSYAQLVYSADTTSEAHRTLVQRAQEATTTLHNRLLFFELEWIGLDDAAAERLLTDPQLTNYAHYLRHRRSYRPHTLSEAEERLINDKDLTGIQAWQRLFTEFTAAQTFNVEVNGQTCALTQSEVLTLMRHPDREQRRRAHEAFYSRLAENGLVSSFIYDTRFHDHLITLRLRHYQDPMQPRHLANQIDGEAVEAMIQTVERNYALAHRYFRFKARLLGLPRLELFDQYAPIETDKPRIPWSEARQLVVEALSHFSPHFGEMAQRCFTQRWIDAAPRPGKRGGAFCAGVSPSSNPYVLMSYTDDLRDVMTLTHELGHAIHDMHAARQTLLNYSPSLPLAETASVFAEMLVFDHLLPQLAQPRQRLSLLCAKIEDSFATLFRQTVLTRFEQKVYAARQQGRLGAAQLGQLWLQANAPYYGDAVNLTAGYEWGWSYIPHFIHTPFYCYAYAFGELLVMALYGMFRQQGDRFIPRYQALLASGGSRTPAEQLAELGVDITDPNFWQVGFDELARLVDAAEQLAA
ncbi:MAG: M3 family oligoendopeptidase [Thermoflexales bacterium]